jgi:serine/threonine-protein kinase
VGVLVRGRYAIKSIAGTGRTGAVYLVKDQMDQEPQSRLLALKEMRVPDQQARYRFTIGGTFLRQLQYPTLPRIHALFNDDKRGCVYMVMEYVEGERLADVPWGHLTWPELRIWCEPLIATLSYLHRQEQPLFHGDLKPANLLRNKSGKIMLVDLGYVPQESDTSQPNPYRAPEQFAGIIDERSDVYGCGALLYTLLVGTEPAGAFTRHERVSKKKTDSLVLASKLSADIPRDLAEVLQRALALDPAERFATVKEFWDALSPLVQELDRQQASV